MTDPEEEAFGLLILDKPTGITSHTAVRRAARHLGGGKAGHAGTLDPLASGVLLVGLGRATRLLEYLVGHDKEYRARIRLGETRDTLDREGRLLETCAVPELTAAEIEEALTHFRGPITQVPPSHSAIKINGQPLYRRARQGEAVEAPPRRVEISRLDLVCWEPPDLVVDLACSSGTYVRSVARDLGRALGTGATLWELVRTRSGPFRLEEAVTLDALEVEGRSARARVRAAGEMVRGLRALTVEETAVRVLATGQPLPGGELPEGSDVAVFDEDGRLVAIARPNGTGLRPLKVLRPAA